MTQTHTTDITDILERFGLGDQFDTPTIDQTLDTGVDEYTPQSRVGQRMVEGAGLALSVLAAGYIGTALLAGMPTESQAAQPISTSQVDIPWHPAYASASKEATIPAIKGQHYLLNFDGQEFAVSIDPSVTGLHINDGFVSFERGTNCEVGVDSSYCVGSLTYNPDTNMLGFTAYKTEPLDTVLQAGIVETDF